MAGAQRQFGPSRPETVRWRLYSLLAAGLLGLVYGVISSLSGAPGALLCSTAGALGAQLRALSSSWRETAGDPLSLRKGTRLLLSVIPAVLGAAFGAATYYLATSIIVTDRRFLNVRGLSLLAVALTYTLDALVANSLALANELALSNDASATSLVRVAERLEASSAQLLDRSTRADPALARYTGFVVFRIVGGQTPVLEVGLRPEPPDPSEGKAWVSRLLRVQGEPASGEIEFEVQLVSDRSGYQSPDRVVLRMNPSEASTVGRFTVDSAEHLTDAWIRISQLGRTVQLFPVSESPSSMAPQR